MKNKKIIIGIIAIVLIIVIAIISFIIIKNNEQKQVSNLLIEYFNLINDQNYDAMYEKVASMNLSKDDFLARNKNIYEGIDAKNIKIEIEQIEKNSNNYQVSYNEHMYTAAGEIKFSNTATNTIKSSQKFDWEKLGNDLTSVAARFNSQNTQTNYTANNNRTYAPQWDLSQDSRFQRIRNYRLWTGAMV